MSRTTSLIDIVDFSNALLDTLDLDPVYVILYRGDLKKDSLRRWLLAYWCSYHAGVSSKIAEAKDFYKELHKFQDEKWPRGRERRHFRGTASEKAITWLEKEFPEPESAVDSLKGAGTFKDVEDRIIKWPLFGPWIAFKAADMLERVLGWNVKIEAKDLDFYKEPAEGAKLFYPELSLQEAVDKLNSKLSKRKAPPGNDRPFGTAESETCFCKGKSAANGHYFIGQDTQELRHALKGWGPLADKLKKELP